MKNQFFSQATKQLAALCALAFAGNSLALDLNVVALNKLSETRIDRTTYDYVFSVTVKNGEQAITNAAQTLTASGAGTTILDGNVVIGDLASGEQITPADTIKIRHNRATAFNPSALVWSATGTPVVAAANRELFSETFDVDKATLFSSAYKSISSDAAAPLFFVTGGNSGITVANNQLTLAAARFTIGHKPPRANTTSGDTNANGDFDLSKPYRISFRVVAASGSGAVQVMVDNNTTSAGNSLHGSASRIFNASANSLVAGQIIELQPTVGTANSFIALRTESSASVTIDDLVIEYLDDVVGGSSSSVASSVAASSIAPSSVIASSIASSSVASSVALSSAPASAPASSNSSAVTHTSSSVSSYDGALRPAKMEGFAAHAGVTGGAGGALVTVTTGTELNAALCSRATMSTPITILVNGTISHANTTAQGCNTQADVIEIKQMSNVSIIGVGTNALFEEIGIHVRDASNIILQNLHIRNVKKSGSPVSNGGDAIGMETNVNRVWIDHNWLEASGGEKDGYDSLLDMKAGVTNVTVSYNLFNDSSRAGLIGSSDSDNKNTNITFHHNWYKNIEQRTPLIRHALVHMYNNYWSNDRMDYMFHAINSRMNAKALVESNYFYNVNNPLIASDDSSVPGCWQTNNDNTVLPEIYYSRTLGNGALVIPQVVDGQLQSTCAVTVPYVVEMDAAQDVPAIVMANVGTGKISGSGVVVTSSAASSSVASSAALSSTTPSSTAPSSTAPSSVAASSIAPSSVAASSEAASSIASSTATTSDASSSVAPVVSALINEAFAVDKNTLFSAAYQSISTDAAAPLYFITGGSSGITIANNELTLAGARFTIGNRPPRSSTTAGDTNANGDFDLTRPYRISFKVIAASGSGKLQVYVDNNTTSQGNSIHGANSKVYEVVASSLTAGQQVNITPAVGTGNSFIALRTESSATVTIDNLVLEYTDGAGVSSSASSIVTSSTASSVAVSSAPSSAIASSTPSSAIASSLSSASSSAPYIPENVNLSADCISIATNPNVNWRDTALQTDQEIVECLSQSLGKPVGYGENAKGGYDANGNSKLTIITKNSSVTVEQQLINALTDNAHNWIVFDKVEFAQPHEIGMYRQYCADATTLSVLGTTEAECRDYRSWCANKGFTNEATCRTEFFNKTMNKSNIPIRIPAIGSNKTLDGRGTEAYFIFSGFQIGRDSNGVPTQTSQSVILTHLKFQGAGHTEDHYVDPDMIRSTGASQDIWIHKNTFDTTGDSAFDVKIGANHITMSFNRLVNVKRAVLHGSSDSRTINANITTTMHHNAFVTTDDSYMLLGNTLRRVPLLRRGKTHMFNNVFVNYRKEILSLRVGASAFLEDNAFVVNSSLQEKSSVEASLSEIANNYFKDISGGFFRNDRNFLWFGSGSCVVNEATKTALTASNGTVVDLSQNYNAASLNAINGWRFAAGQDLVDYVTLTAGKHGDAPFNSPLSPDRTYMEALTPVSCQ